MATNKKEEFKLSGDEIIEKIKSIVKEGNARKIIIKNENGETDYLSHLKLTYVKCDRSHYHSLYGFDSDTI
jgi:hypothetical protein